MKRLITCLLFSSVSLIGAGCGDGSSSSLEPENPYSAGSGHSAGYEWAERTGGDCSGSSASFNEGCEEYYRQLENVE